MKAIFILALFCYSALAVTTPLTPNTNMPQIFDNMIINTLQNNIFPQKTLRKFNFGHKSMKFPIEGIPLNKAGKFIRQSAPTIPLKFVSVILRDIMQLRNDADKIYSYLASYKKKKRNHSAMVNVVKEGPSYYFQSSTFQPIQQPKFPPMPPFLVRSESSSGMPLKGFKNLFNSPSINNAFKMMNNLYFSSIKNARGSPLGSIKSGLGMVDPTALVSTLAQTYSSVAQAFKTESKETFQKVIQGKGFAQFQQDTTFLNNQGIRLKRYDNFKKNYVVTTETDSNKELKEKTLSWLELAEICPTNDGFELENMFDENKDGTTSTLTVLSSLNEVENKINILTIKTKGAYKLTPDVYIYEKSKSVAGGIYQEMKEKREYRARSLKEDDIKALNAMAITNTLIRLKSVFNIDFKVRASKPEDLFVN